MDRWMFVLTNKNASNFYFNAKKYVCKIYIVKTYSYKFMTNNVNKKINKNVFY